MQPPAHDPYLGTALAGGRYRILRRLGESDFGALYQAEARSNDGIFPVAA